MKGVLPSFIAIGVGVAGLARSLPEAIERDYHHLPLASIAIAGWAVWLGGRAGVRGPGQVPASWVAPAAVAGLGAIALALGWPAIAGLALGPGILFLVRAVKPEWATPRILFLMLLAPLELALDNTWGGALRAGTADGASWLARLSDPTIGRAIGEVIQCGPHEVFVTPACSGARFVVRMVTLAGVFAVLKPGTPPLRFFALLLAGVAIGLVANTARVASVCAAAPDYAFSQLPDLETYHDVSGLVSFAAAYAVLGLAALLIVRRRST